MANMNYCRFWNTSHDMKDCIEALYDGATLEGDELRACRNMFNEVLEFFEDNDIAEVNWDEFEYWLEAIAK